MNDKPKQDEFSIKRTARLIKRNRERALATGDMSHLGAGADNLPHYHILYNAYIYLQHRFDTEQAVLKAISTLGTKSEPNTVWYEEGPVQIETTLHERTGLHQVLLTAVECHRKCNRVVRIEDMKRLGWVE